MRHVAFVRNIMIGREGLTRQVLLGIFETHGATGPVSYISTGNVGFTCDATDLERVVAGVEDSIAGVLGRREPLYVRSLARLVDIVEAEPFAGPFEDVSQERLVTFTHDPVDLSVDVPLLSDRGDFALVGVSDREIYSVTMLIDGRTRAPGGFIERLVGNRVTTRSWNTVQRVVTKESDRG